jgi:hypothetical protein
VSGKIVGEVITASKELRSRGVSKSAFYALVAIAEKTNHYTREGQVRWEHICDGLYGKSVSTARRAVKELIQADLIEVSQKGYRNRFGSQATIYRVLALTTQVTKAKSVALTTQVTKASGSSFDHFRSSFDHFGSSFDHADALTSTAAAHDGNDGNDGGARPEKSTETAEPPRHCQRHPGNSTKPCGDCKQAREENDAWKARQSERLRAEGQARRQAIDDCPLCDQDGHRLGDDGLPSDNPAKCNHKEHAA